MASHSGELRGYVFTTGANEVKESPRAVERRACKRLFAVL